MSKFISLEEIRKICKENTLVEKIRTLSDDIESSDDKTKDKELEKIIPDIRKLIQDVMPKDKKAKPEHIKQYIEELRKELPPDEEKKDISIPPPGIQPKSEDLPLMEKTNGKVEGEKEIVYLNKKDLEKLNFTKDKIAEHEETIVTLKNKIESLEEKLKVPSPKEVDKKNPLSEIPILNELLNSCNEKITVTINKELLSKATKFVDEHSLIRLESIIRDGYDLNSTVVQSILLAFIHQNSLI